MRAQLAAQVAGGLALVTWAGEDDAQAVGVYPLAGPVGERDRRCCVYSWLGAIQGSVGRSSVKPWYSSASASSSGGAGVGRLGGAAHLLTGLADLGGKTLFQLIPEEKWG